MLPLGLPRPSRIGQPLAASRGAGLMLLLRVTDARAAFFSEETGIDWNVVFLLLGMMVIVSVLRQTGVFEYVVIWAAKRARGKPYRLMVMLVVITMGASALLDNEWAWLWPYRSATNRMLFAVLCQHFRGRASAGE
ncbi:SLC13 family permease [Spirillospora sp. NPDC000708]